jgi:hypothetical protein
LGYGSTFYLQQSLVANNAIDTLDTDTWVGMYEEMTNCAYDTTILPRVDDVYQPTLQYGSDTINMLVMNFDYYRFKPNALNTNIYFDFDTINNIITDKAIRPGFPYDDFKVFAVAPSTTQTANGFVVYRVGTDNIFYDQFNLLNGTGGANANILEIDFGDGNGYQNVILGQDNYFNVAYNNVGTQIIQAQVRVGNQPRVSYSRSKIHNLQVANPLILPDNPIQSLHNLNVATYEPCSGTPLNQIKTIIYLEGIDIPDCFPSQNRNAINIYGSQIFATGLADLRNFGYRFIVVDWQNSRIDMRDNARNVINLINDLKCQGADVQNDEQYVIIGESMGGIIAKMAMIEMEQNHNSPCFPEKEHNTRLLITLDAPHGGAHIPMSVQKMSNFLRNTAGAIAGTSLVGPGLGVPLGIIGTKLFFKSQDLLLDATAAKQLLMDHVSTQSLLWPHTYNMHKERKILLDELQSKGNYPRHTKLFAISNGNMMGHNQTRLWDGAPRLDGDTLLKVNARATVRILGTRFPYSGLDLRMNADPNGVGNIGGINFGTFWFKIKLKFFGVKILTGFNSLCAKDWDADMRPISNKAGGIYDIYENYFQGGDFLNNNSGLNYNGQGIWENINNANRFGTSVRVKTDGMHFNFVPVSSALDFGNALTIPFDLLPTAIITGNSPFDVSMGWKGDSLYGTSTLQQGLLGENITLRNQIHTAFRNDTLYTDQTNKIQANAILYTTFCTGAGTNANRPIRAINREIGDDLLYVENRVLPWQGAYSVSDDIFVNIPSPYYSYPSQPNLLTTLPSVFSKRNPLIITNTGFGIFNTSIGNLNYNTPFTGPYGQFASGLGACCNTYSPRIGNPIYNPIAVPKQIVSIYPNPNTGNFVLDIRNNNNSVITYTITDLMGKIIETKIVSNLKPLPNVKIPIQLQSNLPKGLYLIHIKHSNKQETLKINLQ